MSYVLMKSEQPILLLLRIYVIEGQRLQYGLVLHPCLLITAVQHFSPPSR